METKRFYPVLTVEKLSNKLEFQALYFNERTEAIYTIIFNDNLFGAAEFNYFLAQITKRYPEKIEFRNYTGQSFKTPGLEVYFRFEPEYFEQPDETGGIPL